MQHLKLLVLFVGLLSCQKNFAQVSPPCPSPPPPGAESCSLACVYCNLDGYSGTNSGTPSGGNIICSQIVLQNDQWFGFVADSTSITFTLDQNNCEIGDGLQMAIFEDCTASDALTCNPSLAGSAGISLSLTYDQFIPGRTYFLMLDGFNGDVCDFTIHTTIETSGNGMAPDTPVVPKGITQVCPGATVEYQIDSVPNAGFYLWSAPAGAVINGVSNPLYLAADQGTQVSVFFGNASGNVCVQAGNGCSPLSQSACLSINNQPIPTTTLPPLTICAEELPYTWLFPPFPILENPGSYTLVSIAESYLGCDSTIKQTVHIKPPLVTNLGNIYVCTGDCFEFDQTPYCDAGNYVHLLNSYQGCDSAVVFQLIVLDPAGLATIQAPQGQTITCLQPWVSIQGISSPNLQHLWLNQSGSILSDNASVSVFAQGLYTHQVRFNQGPATCLSTQTIFIKQNNLPPPVTAMGGVLDAAHPTVQLKGHSIISGLTYHWTGPGNFSSSLKNPIVSLAGIYTLTVTHPQTGCSNSIQVEVSVMN